jgi:hypothetical protein
MASKQATTDRFEPERDREPLTRTRPALGILWLLVALIGMGCLTYLLLLQFPAVEQHFPGGNVPAVAAVGILLVFVLRIIDAAVEGKVFLALAKILFWGFPGVVATAETLPLWYEYDRLRGLPPDEVTDRKKDRLVYLKDRLLGHYREHGNEDDLVLKRPFSSWMVADVVPHYENNVEALAYFGAGLLIVVVGLRGINYITKDHPEPIILALFIEFSIIALLGLLKFFKPEQSEVGYGKTGSIPPMAELLRLRSTVDKLLTDHDKLTTDVTSIDKGLKDLQGGLDRLNVSRR